MSTSLICQLEVLVRNALLNDLLTYLLTHSMKRSPSWEANPFSVTKFPTFYDTRRFITAFTSARHLSLSWTSSIHSIPPHHTSWRSILILSFHLRPFSQVALSLRFPHQNSVYTSPFPHMRKMPRPSHSVRNAHLSKYVTYPCKVIPQRTALFQLKVTFLLFTMYLCLPAVKAFRRKRHDAT